MLGHTVCPALLLTAICCLVCCGSSATSCHILQHFVHCIWGCLRCLAFLWSIPLFPCFFHLSCVGAWRMELSIFLPLVDEEDAEVCCAPVSCRGSRASRRMSCLSVVHHTAENKQGVRERRWTRKQENSEHLLRDSSTPAKWAKNRQKVLHLATGLFSVSKITSMSLMSSELYLNVLWCFPSVQWSGKREISQTRSWWMTHLSLLIMA